MNINGRTVVSNSHPILLVDDEQEILALTRFILSCEGFQNVVTLHDSSQVLPFLERNRVSVIVLDVLMPQMSGIELLPAIVANLPEIPVIILTGSDDLRNAINCLKAGAFDYMLKPVEPGQLLAAIHKALQVSELKEEVSTLKRYLLSDHLEHKEAFRQIITRSKKMRAVFQYAEAVSKSAHPILINGETGVGKELMAWAIHRLSGVTGGFVRVNVAALDEQMFSDTMFGHKKGAFSGADRDREGLIAKAAGGTLFLDEIGDMSASSQIKLLRLLQEQEFYPLGSDSMKTVEARIIVATNQNLQTLSEAGKFRKDLYYRLCTHQITIPPLRERSEDISLLLEHFIQEASLSLGKTSPLPSSELMETLPKIRFPGNVREFRAVVTDAVARHKTGLLTLKHFPAISLPVVAVSGKSNVLEVRDKEAEWLYEIFGKFPTLEESEDYLINHALKVTNGNKSASASLLGLTRQTLSRRQRGRQKI
jgi:two-component system, NtrC family, response regulator HydG